MSWTISHDDNKDEGVDQGNNKKPSSSTDTAARNDVNKSNKSRLNSSKSTMNQARLASDTASLSIKKQLTSSTAGKPSSDKGGITNTCKKLKVSVLYSRIIFPSSSFPSITVQKKHFNSDGIPAIKTAASMETDLKTSGTTEKNIHREARDFGTTSSKQVSRHAIALHRNNSENGTKSKRWHAFGLTKSFKGGWPEAANMKANMSFRQNKTKHANTSHSQEVKTTKNFKSNDSLLDFSLNTYRVSDVDQNDDTWSTVIQQQNASRVSTLTSVNSNDCNTFTTTCNDNNELEQHLTALVRKRRTGRTSRLHSHSKGNKLWERRRITLKGQFLCYYESTNKTIYGDEDEEVNTGRPTNEDKESSSTSELVESDGWKQQQEDNPGNSDDSKSTIGGLRSLLEHVKQHVSTRSISTIKDEEPRGVMDLAKEHASVIATSEYGAPTPFVILVEATGIVAGEGKKWRLCFDTQHQQMEWLVYLSGVVVTCGVENYNQEHGLHEEAEYVREKKFYVPTNVRNVSWVEYKSRGTAIRKNSNEVTMETVNSDENGLWFDYEVVDSDNNRSVRTLLFPTRANFGQDTAVTTTWTVSGSSLRKLVGVTNILLIGLCYLAATKEIVWTSFGVLIVTVNFTFWIHIKTAEPLYAKIRHRLRANKKCLL